MNRQHAWSRACGPWQVAGLSLTGPRHAVCEDHLGARFTAGGGLHLALADGVSQGARGDLASEILTHHCLDWRGAHHNDIPNAGDVSAWLLQGEQEVITALAQVTPAPGAATLAAAWLDRNGAARLNHVGDCRIYSWWPHGPEVVLCPETVDQTYGNLGETPPSHCPLDNPARMLGVHALGEPESHAIQLYPGDGLLLCSDGLHGVLDDLELARLMAAALAVPTPPGRPEHALAILATRLAHEARHQGSEDDISVLVMRWRG